MSDRLKIEYRGYVIYYSDNEDNWWCPDLGAGKSASSESVRKIRERIDKTLLSERKAHALTCFELGHSLGDTSVILTEVSIVEYIGPKFEGGSHWSKREMHVSSHSVGAIGIRSGKDRASRVERDLTHMMPDTQEAFAALSTARALQEDAKAASKAAEDAFKAIPRVTIDQIEALVRISGIDPTGGLPK